MATYLPDSYYPTGYWVPYWPTGGTAAAPAPGGPSRSATVAIVTRTGGTMGIVIIWMLGPDFDGATLAAKLYGVNGVAATGQLTAGFYERLGNSGVFAQYLDIVDTFYGWADVYEASDPSEVLLSVPIGEAAVDVNVTVDSGTTSGSGGTSGSGSGSSTVVVPGVADEEFPVAPPYLYHRRIG